MYVERNIEGCSRNHCCSGKAKIIAYSECVFVALIPPCDFFFWGFVMDTVCASTPRQCPGSSQPYHRYCGSGRPWYADTRVERDGLPHRCLPYYQRWTHWASVKYVKKLRASLSISVRTTTIRRVVYLLWIFEMFHGLMNNPVQ